MIAFALYVLAAMAYIVIGGAVYEVALRRFDSEDAAIALSGTWPVAVPLAIVGCAAVAALFGIAWCVAKVASVGRRLARRPS